MLQLAQRRSAFDALHVGAVVAAERQQGSGEYERCTVRAIDRDARTLDLRFDVGDDAVPTAASAPSGANNPEAPLGLRWAESSNIVPPLGAKWRSCPAGRPASGVEMHSDALAAAIQQSTRDFGTAELDAFGIRHLLQPGSFIQVGDAYYELEPAPDAHIQGSGDTAAAGPPAAGVELTNAQLSVALFEKLRQQEARNFVLQTLEAPPLEFTREEFQSFELPELSPQMCVLPHTFRRPWHSLFSLADLSPHRDPLAALRLSEGAVLHAGAVLSPQEAVLELSAIDELSATTEHSPLYPVSLRHAGTLRSAAPTPSDASSRCRSTRTLVASSFARTCPISKSTSSTTQRSSPPLPPPPLTAPPQLSRRARGGTTVRRPHCPRGLPAEG